MTDQAVYKNASYEWDSNMGTRCFSSIRVCALVKLPA